MSACGSFHVMRLQKRKFDPSHPRHSAAMQKLRAEMKARNLDAYALAKELGYTSWTMRVLLTRGVEKHCARLAIEHYFGIPFWSDEFEMRRRNCHLVAMFGSDKTAIPRSKLMALAKRMRVACGGRIATQHLPLLIADKAVQDDFRAFGIKALREQSDEVLQNSNVDHVTREKLQS